MTKKKGFTLLDSLIAVIILGILVSIAVANYIKTKEHILDNDAIANLKGLQAAERCYMVDMGTYYPAAGDDSNIATINQYLKVALPSGANRNWDYRVWSSGCSRATRISDSRTWRLRIAETDPVTGGPCP